MLELLYVAALSVLAVYGLNSLLFTALFWLKARSAPHPPPLEGADVPQVTVQLPIYNERYVVERLLTAIAALDYPRDHLQVQVLDDSTDETRDIVDRAAARLRARGLRVDVCRRAQPQGFKGGALADATPHATGEFLTVFDADFLPKPDFLRRALAPFADPRVGCVQARWDHLNADYSILTRLQAATIDGHFIVEQEVRNRMGWFMAFNGSAGIWRRAAVEAAGGWQGDTLTEDLDLSIRAQLQGWRFVFLTDVLVPAEIPAQMDAYKRQQFRWAKGSVQTVKKLLLPILRSRLPWFTRLQAVLQLCGYLTHPLMVVTFLLIVPMSFTQSPWTSILQYLILALFGPITLYGTARFVRSRAGSLGGSVPSGLWGAARAVVHSFGVFVLLIMLGTGMSLNNSRAAVEALLGIRSGFKRTPKFALRSRGDAWWQNRYSLPSDPIVLAEVAAFVVAIAFYWIGYAKNAGHVSQWLLVYAGGYAYVSGLSLWQGMGMRLGRTSET